MKHLAELIRKGLDTESVVEDTEIFGAGMEKDGECHANIVGLALIGKVGVKEACELFESSLSEAGEGPNNKRILMELNTKFPFLEDMVAAHFSGATAEEIAADLENGVFQI